LRASAVLMVSMSFFGSKGFLMASLAPAWKPLTFSLGSVMAVMMIGVSFRLDRIGSHWSTDVVTVHSGHHDIQEDQVGAFLLGLIESGGTIGGGNSLKIIVL
jgi:hypothetical protein